MSKFGILLILLSLAIVIGIVLYLVNPLKQVQDKLDHKRISDLEEIALALEKYHHDYGQYPPSSASYVIQDHDNEFPWGVAWLPYMNTIPKDPGIGKTYVYWSSPADRNQSFRLYASLDDPSASRACAGECPGVPEQYLCGREALCNFGVTSSNISP